jgi:hypothetical protein
MKFSALPLILAYLLIISQAFSQAGTKKEMTAQRIAVSPKIDGILSEDCWQAADEAKDFIQYEPYNGAAPTYNTSVKLVYNDNSVFIGAVMFDPEPGKIMLELGQRDNDELNADLFFVSFSAYNDGLNSLDFFLYASGVQVDVKNFSGGEDISWDAVWKSEVTITDDGWVAEIEIPYSALRFPRVEQQVWGLNFGREIRRFREVSTWNFVDKKIDGIINQGGLLKGISNIKPPLRLSFEPYLSTSVMKEPDAGNWDTKFNGGMDLKYGISESFTLDMTLIPDFSQVPSDDQVVNLGPFETYYSEKRQFFTEGVELFSRGDIFYSRRVGTKPIGYDSIEASYAPEDIVENPEQTRLINATKFSGRTSKGTGVGIFNAMTAPSYATVRDSAGDTPEIQTQPFTNYSMVVADQSLPNKSYISLYNTNVYRGNGVYSANVTGTEMDFRDRRNIFSASGLFNLSQKYYPDKPVELGYAYEVTLFKISGNAKYAIFQEVMSDTYDPNDLGYLGANNDIENGAYFSYDFYDPFWRILDMHNEISVEYHQLYDPREFTSLDIGIENRTQFKNKLTVGLETRLSPIERRDYFEPRNDGWFVKLPPAYGMSAFYSPDYNKTFLVDVMTELYYATDYDQFGYFFRLAPRYKVNNHLFMVLSASYSQNLNDLGYVTDSLSGPDLTIIFGKRNIENITATLNVNYTINPKLSFSGRARYYFFKADYNQYYDLGRDGDLTPCSYTVDEDFIFNAFNIDVYFSWLFAPGSQLSLAWKNAIYTDGRLPSEGYFREFTNTLEAPASNLFSLKLLYYLDSQYFKKRK